MSRCRPDHILTSGLGLLAEARGGGANHSAASSGLQCGEVTVFYPVSGDTCHVYSDIRVPNCLRDQDIVHQLGVVTMVFEGARRREGQDHVLSPFAYFIRSSYTRSLAGCGCAGVLEAGVRGLHMRPHLGSEGEGEVGGVDHAVLPHQTQGNLDMGRIRSLFEL